MQDNWTACQNFVLAQEGGFENNPQDPGTWTGNSIGSGSQIGSNLGISAETLSSFYPNLSISQLSNLMQSLTSDQVENIYSSIYWVPIQGQVLPSGIDLMLFDDAVNKGVSTAVKTIQSCVGTTQDGDLGPLTLAAILGAPSIESLAVALGCAQGALYTQSPQWSTFGLGWSRRWGSRMQASMKLLTS